MAGPYEKVGQQYLNVRPLYPAEWPKMLADLTPSHAVAWDAGTGNGQAAIGVAEHYDQVIATDISAGQLRHAIPHARVRYLHTPASLSDDELVKAVGGENSVDLITVATAVHWFDLPKFYSAAARVLRKPGGLIAVWCYSEVVPVNREFEALSMKFRQSMVPHFAPGAEHFFEEYRNLPFPFESVGMGEEGRPLTLTLARELSFEKWLATVRTFSAVAAAVESGVDLLTEEVVQEFRKAWGGPPDVIRVVNCNVFFIAGKVKSHP